MFRKCCSMDRRKSLVTFDNWHKQQSDRHHCVHKQDSVMIAVEKEREVFV